MISVIACATGAIRLRGKWLHFPIKATDLLLHLDKRFALGMARDLVRKAVLGRKPEGETFASVLQANLGPTMCEHFYFPYARKLWGREPAELSGIQARKRVTAGSFGKLVKRLIKPPGAGMFYYMREGYGQISRAFAEAGRKDGAELMMGWGLDRLERPGNGGKWKVTVKQGDERRTMEADHVWSTIPMTTAARMMDPAPPPNVMAALDEIRFQAMILVYIEVPVDQWTTTDAHYFPEANVSVTRVSEPKNYFGERTPAGRTILCAEVPCTVGDRLWSMTTPRSAPRGRRPRALRDPAAEAADRGVHASPASGVPALPDGYEKHLETVESWFATLPGWLSYGRQGLFAHDNTHHALFMAYSAVDCLQDGRFDQAKWEGYRQIFKTHVVED
jgi:protoporphyrinogen oxidase